MSSRERKAHADQVLGRAEEIVGRAYADPAAEVHGEAVRLRGEAEEEEAAALADRPGHVDPEDAGLRADVLAALMLDPLVPSSVAVRVRNGRVTLAGNVAHQHQRAAAEAAARGVLGVVEVRNDIQLTGASSRHAG